MAPLSGLVSRSWSLCRPGSRRRQTGRSAGPAANTIRAGRQSEDREGTRADDPALDPRPRRRGHRMTRRAALLTAIALCALVANAFPPALAQQPEKVLRIGILSPAASPSTKLFNAFREGLHDRGYVDGQNITIEYRLAAGDVNRLPAMANELVRLPVDIIVADGSKS